MGRRYAINRVRRSGSTGSGAAADAMGTDAMVSQPRIGYSGAKYTYELITALEVWKDWKTAGRLASPLPAAAVPLPTRRR